jgi:uncharacterized membrane protein YbhN (UPF0104 family)
MMNAMRAWFRKAWPYLKLLFAVAILAAIGRQFARDLSRLDLGRHALRLEWLAVSGALYLVALGFSAVYWYLLLVGCGQKPAAVAATRAYYIGHLGKYLPGKAWSLLMRITLIRGPGVSLGTAALTTFYEVMATMAGGVLLAAVLFVLHTPDSAGPIDWRELPRVFAPQAEDQPAPDPRLAAFSSAVLFGVTCGPLVPFLFNRVTNRMTLRFREPNAPPPRVRTVQLLEGLVLTGIGWLFLGASLWAVLQAVVEPAPPWSADLIGRYTAPLALSYVAGFVFVISPGGLGVREYLLTLFLAPDLESFLGPANGEARALAVLAVLLLRVVWTVAEILAAGVLYWLPGPAATTPGETP